MCYNLFMAKKKVKFELKLNKRLSKPLLICLVILSTAAILFNLKSLFFAAFVNGRPITRWALDRQLEKQVGKATLENQITKILILQTAKREKVKVDQEEIEAKVKEIEKQFEDQGTDLDTLLEAQGQKRQDLEEQIRVQLIIEKILGQDIEVTGEEVADYFEKNKNFFPEGSTLESMKENLQTEVRQQKIGDKFQPWLDELKKQAKIYYFLKF